MFVILTPLLWFAKKSLSCASVECYSERGELPKPESVFFSSSFVSCPPPPHTSEERLQARKTELGSDELFQGSAFSKWVAQGCDWTPAGWGGSGWKGKAAHECCQKQLAVKVTVLRFSCPCVRNWCPSKALRLYRKREGKISLCTKRSSGRAT